MKKGYRINPIILARAREMRQPQTPAEATVWRALRNRKTGHKFRRQHPIYRFIIDFYCARAKLLIEIDGASHLQADQIEYDTARTEYLEELGYKLIRFTNNDVRYNLNSVVGEILRMVERRIAELKSKKSISLSPHPSPLPAGERGKDRL
jgi:very-short-patch-repair endonuclease